VENSISYYFDIAAATASSFRNKKLTVISLCSLGCKYKGTRCSRNDTFTILNPVLVALPQMIPQELVLPEGTVPVVDTNRTNAIIKQTLDKFWLDMEQALTGQVTDCPECIDTLFINVTMIDLMFDGKLKKFLWNFIHLDVGI
jgi:hypothetical protein